MKNIDKIFERFMNAADTRTIEFENATRKEKIEALRAAGAVVEDSKKYPIIVSRARTSYDSDEQFIKVAAQIAPLQLANIFVDGKVRPDASVSVKVMKRGSELNEGEILSVLSKQVKIEGGKIEVENLGGQNFVEFIAYAAGRLGLIK